MGGERRSRVGMRCLHCGKDLPLLKRLTGGEFCTDEHRQAYQREYSQMALSRLLQAKPPIAPDEPAHAEAEPSQELALVKRGAKHVPASVPAPLSGKTAGTKALPPKKGPLTLGLSGDSGENTSARSEPEPAGTSTGLRPQRTQDQPAPPQTPSITQERAARDAATPEQPTAHAQNTFRPKIESEAQVSSTIGKTETGKTEPARTEASPSVSSPPASSQASTKEAHAPAPLGSVCPELPIMSKLDFLPPQEIPADPTDFPAQTGASNGQPALKLAPHFPAIMRAVRVDLFDGTLRPAAERPDSSGLDGELALVDFTRTAHIADWISSVDSVGTFLRVTESVPVRVELCPAPGGSVWHISECGLQELAVEIGELSRLDFPSAEMDDSEPRTRQRILQNSNGPVESVDGSSKRFTPILDAEGDTALALVGAPSRWTPSATAAQLQSEAPKPPVSPGNGTFRRPATIKLVRPAPARNLTPNIHPPPASGEPLSVEVRNSET